MEKRVKYLLCIGFLAYCFYTNWGAMMQHSAKSKPWDLSSNQIIWMIKDMRMELGITAVASTLFYFARRYNDHLDRLEEEALQ